MSNPSSEPAVTPEDPRYELQGLLGEYHGLQATIVHWLREYAQNQEINELVAAVDNAFPGASVAFGEVRSRESSTQVDTTSA
jgi:hypothetical protein